MCFGPTALVSLVANHSSPALDSDRRLGEARELIQLFRQGDNDDQVRRRCRGVDPELELFCGLLMHIAGGRGNARAFLDGAPHTRQKASALWRWDELLAKNADAAVDTLFPSGFAARYVDEMVKATISAGDVGLPRLLQLYEYADASYKEYIDDELLKLLVEHPKLFFTNWDRIRPYRGTLRHLVEDDEAPSQLRADFERLCKGSTTTRRCEEIRDLWPRRAE